MALTQGTLRFIRRDTADKTNKDGKAAIGLLYSLRGQRKYLAVKRVKLYAKNWDSERQRAIYINKLDAQAIKDNIDFKHLLTLAEEKAVNNAIDRLTSDIEAIEGYFKANQIPFDVSMVVDRYKENQTAKPVTKKVESKNNLIAYIEVYISDNKAQRVKGSMVVFGTLKKYLQKFHDATGSPVAFESSTFDFIQQFKNFLINTTPLINSTINKQLSTLKTLLNYAKKNDKPVNGGYKNFKLEAIFMEVVALTLVEFERLYNFDFKENWRFAEQRDAFCFSCATGLRYSDLRQLNWVHIKENALEISAVKKGTSAASLLIPLNKYSKAILEKYKGKAKPLPVISNQKMNAALKNICKLVKIDEPIEIIRKKGGETIKTVVPKWKKISAHVGRKTFVTLSLERGMSAEVTMGISGHKDYRSFKRYVNIDEARKATAMQQAWDA